jgi:zona occludens toxin
LTKAEYLLANEPRIAGLAYTAPIYDKVTEPEEAPVPVACIESASKGCKCYSQQATLLSMPQDLCRQIVRNGFFLAFSIDKKSRDGVLTSTGQRPKGQSEPVVSILPKDQPATLTGYSKKG